MKSTSDMLLVVHVPKTAGTSLRRALDKYFGQKYVIRDYGEKAKATSDIVRSHLYSDNRTSPKALACAIEQSEAKVLVGHFPAQKFAPFFKPENVIVFVRDPLERTCSEYLHRVRHQAYKLPFEQFIQKQHLINIQSRFLEHLPDQAIIGITERYSDSLRYINSIFGIDLKEMNVNKARTGGGSGFSEKLSKSQLDLFNELNKKDIELYASCLQQFSALEIPNAPKNPFFSWIQLR